MAHSSRLEFFTGFNSEKQELGGKLKNILGEIGLREDPATVNNRLDGRMISESLIHAFRRALDGVRGIEQKKYQLFREQRLRVFRQADEYIRHNLSRPIRIADLAVLIGVSQRSLELLFRDYYGVSPVRYLKMRRLHAAREKLLESGPDNQTVAALAAAHGFAHLGRFARSYRQQFGEYPSDTLACTRGR